ncbi:CPBP family intramembrane glutamic endopeptidase [Formosa haliotis]|uniref:CPBP family intramembrane glutamic endopeptidase n=1 Tax=Formosa haliotis TaxID=1555194 RepID=UPI000824450A|nr:type II CAAX endopeptidase family protein [Formosa haliotis]
MKQITVKQLVLVAALWAFFTFIFSKLLFPHHDDRELKELVSTGLSYNIAIAALMCLVFSYFKQVNIRVGLNKIRTKKNWILYYPVFVIMFAIIVNAAQGIYSDIGAFGWIFINCFFVGISEELMFRGVLLSGLVNKIGFIMAAVCVVVLFGLIHVFNVFVTGNLLQGIAQAFMAMSSGILFLAIRVKTQSIVSAIIIHWLWDFIAFSSSSSFNEEKFTGLVDYLALLVSILLILSPVIFGILGLVQLRKKQVVADFMETQQPEIQ